jgi:cell division protein FtsB
MRIHFIISTTIGFFLGQSKKKLVEIIEQLRNSYKKKLAENATLEAENKKLKDQLKANESVLTKSKVGEVNKQSNKPSSK